jgi:hypothetical protein
MPTLTRIGRHGEASADATSFKGKNPDARAAIDGGQKWADARAAGTLGLHSDREIARPRTFVPVHPLQRVGLSSRCRIRLREVSLAVARAVSAPKVSR